MPRPPKKRAPRKSATKTAAKSDIQKPISTPKPATASKPVLWTRSEVANQLGVTRAMLTRPTQPDGELAPAITSGKIDVTHKAFQIWAAERGCDLTLLRLTRDPATFVTELDAAGIDLNTVPEMTIAEACQTFGSIPGLQSYLRLRRDMIETATKEHALGVRKGQYIDRLFAKQHVLALVDAAFRRLLSDHVKTGARCADSLSKSGAPIEEIELALRESVSSALKFAKDKSIKLLRKSKHAEGNRENEADQ